MTILDWALVVIWTGITLGGFFKGAIRIVFSLGGLALGIWLAIVVGPDLAARLVARFDNDVLGLGLAYLAPVVVVSLLCLLAGWGMEKTLEKLKLGCLNRLLGAVLAGGAAAAVLAVLLVTAVRISPELAAYERRSVLLEQIQTAMGWAAENRPGDDAEDEGQEAEAAAEAGEPEETSGGSNGR
jgi:uncharacterized membrane protein required for colicin V production